MVALVSGVLSFASAANAVTYNVNRTIGTGTVTGFVVTDDTLGILGSANITNWELTLTAPNLNGGSPGVIDFANPGQTLVQGSALVATSTELQFDFAAAVGSFFILQGSNNNFWCVQVSNECVGVGPAAAELMGFTTAGATFLRDFTGETGSIVIG
jgi:hypothetical protein